MNKRQERLQKQAQLQAAQPLPSERETFKIPDATTNWKKYTFWIGGGIITAILLVIFFYKTGTPTDSGPVSGSIKPGQSVDGIPCQTREVLTYHVHAHLTILADGQSKEVPAGVGIANPQTDARGFVATGSCFMWLHTHDNSGIVHIEGPNQQDFTLGQFFDIWGQTLSSTEVAGTKGTVTAYLDGKKVDGDPRNIKLSNHESIVLMLGKSAPIPANFNFTASGL